MSEREDPRQVALRYLRPEQLQVLESHGLEIVRGDRLPVRWQIKCPNKRCRRVYLSGETHVCRGGGKC